MNIGLQQGSERIVHQSMPLHQRFAGKRIRHDSHIKVPHSACAVVTGVGRTVIANLKLNGMQAIVHYRTDSFNPGGGQLCWFHQAARRCSHSACPIPSAASARVRPKTLKYTQVCSLAAWATYKLNAPRTA